MDWISSSYSTYVFKHLTPDFKPQFSIECDLSDRRQSVGGSGVGEHGGRIFETGLHQEMHL